MKLLAHLWRHLLVEVREADLALSDQPAVLIGGVEVPELLGASAMNRRGRDGDGVADLGLAQEVAAVVGADHDAPIPQPHLAGDARRRLVHRAVGPAVRDAERLKVVLADGEPDDHLVGADLDVVDAEDAVESG